VHERRINPAEIEAFDDCFLTGSAAELSSVACIEIKLIFLIQNHRIANERL
jgi:branched-subunit amino acid aminotransferase/4-amino-4-deoxychorismate lyase